MKTQGTKRYWYNYVQKKRTKEPDLTDPNAVFEYLPQRAMLLVIFWGYLNEENDLEEESTPEKRTTPEEAYNKTWAYITEMTERYK